MPANLFLKRLLKFISLLIVAFNLTIFNAIAQSADTSQEVQLQEVVVKAFERNRKLKDVPAAINYIGRQTLERFSSASVVSAINTAPGVRMEERSPGSYRFNIRGSALRSPFGVRNVKVYINDLPFTDPGGHTYLNQLGYYNFNSIEIIKGPGSSLYGAGTGGVMLIESMNENQQPGIFGEYATGSYNMQNLYGSVSTGTEKLISRVSIQHQTSNGYRNHAELRRDVLSWTGIFRFDETRQLRASFIYGDLFYETPGALTLTEYNSNPRMARPSAGFFPGAETARAAIFQKTFLAGASYTQQLSSKFSSKSALYGAFTQLRNPTLRNYGRSSEPHVGGRTVFTFQQPFSQSIFTINAGAEWQQGFSSVSIHKNANGRADSLQTFDEIHNRNSFAFAQASLDFDNWTVTAGASYNQIRVRFQRFVPTPFPEQNRRFSNEIAPRFSVLKKFNDISVYTSIAKGFSPPSTPELLPSGSTINLDLNAEDGTNYDLGVRGTFFRSLYIDVNTFLFYLSNTIVQRRDAGGGEFFINAGKTKQHGIETYISYPFLQSSALINRSIFWLSHTWHNFHYKDFKQLTFDFSGNRLPGVPPHTLSTGLDFLAHNGLLATLTYYNNSKIALNDANSEYADAYHLIGAKAGYEKWIKNKFRIKVFAGVENLLNEKYSLGNDINGFGGRYYNPAAGRNYYAAIVLNPVFNRR